MTQRLEDLIHEIKSKRETLGITQAELADEAGVSQSYIAKIEAGVINPSYHYLDRIIQTLNQLTTGEPTAQELMTPEIHDVSPTDPVNTALSIMKEHGFSQLPVIKNGSCIGSVTETLLFEKLSESRDIRQKPVNAVMDNAFPIISPSTPRSSITPLLQHHAAVLVSQHGTLTGIITKTNLL